MNDPTQGQAPSRSATLILTSSGPDDLSMEVEYTGADDADGIDRTNVAHNLVDHFVQQLIAGADQLKQRAEEAARPMILVPGGAHV